MRSHILNIRAYRLCFTEPRTTREAVLRISLGTIRRYAVQTGKSTLFHVPTVAVLGSL